MWLCYRVACVFLRSVKPVCLVTVGVSVSVELVTSSSRCSIFPLSLYTVHDFNDFLSKKPACVEATA